MRLTLRLMVSLPVVALCAILGGTALAHTTTPRALSQQHVQMAAHAIRRSDVPRINSIHLKSLFTAPVLG